MLLTQTILLSLCLGTNAHHIRGGHFGGGKGSSGGASGTSGDSSTASSSAVAAATSSATSSAASSSSSSGSSVAAGVGNSTSTADNTAGGGSGSGSGASLLAANIQPASDSTGGAAVELGQSNSATDPDNFINFCSGKNTTDGFQVVTGSCNGIVMGDIPASTNMISSIITNPAPGDTLAANTNFTVDVQVTNLEAGVFTNPLTTYYSAPQALKNGNIIGHTHVTIQSLGNSLTVSTPPDPQTFAFFKGINDAGNGNGLLSATVAGGLPAGAYRVCTLTSAANHQPVLMPVAQRGSQDDCTKFLVSDSGSAAAGSGSASSAGSGAASSVVSASAASAAATSVAAAGTGSSAGGSTSGSNSTVSAGSSSNAGGSSGGSSKFGSGRFGHGGRFARRAFIA